MTVQDWLKDFPLIAILRGITESEVVAVANTLVHAGFKIIEVPLNSPEPLKSIATLVHNFPNCLIGAGTVTSPADVDAVAAAGGKLIVMPHSDAAVIRQAKALGLICLPGVATPTEAFAALAAGADGLKMFPADQLGTGTLKAWRSVLPKSTLLIPVGGIDLENIADYMKAGADGIGLGSALYQPQMSIAKLSDIALRFSLALEKFHSLHPH